MPATASSTDLRSLLTPTIQLFRFWHWAIERNTRLYKPAWNGCTYRPHANCFVESGLDNSGASRLWLRRGPLITSLMALPDLAGNDDTCTLALVCLAVDYPRALAALGARL